MSASFSIEYIRKRFPCAERILTYTPNVISSIYGNAHAEIVKVYNTQHVDLFPYETFSNSMSIRTNVSRNIRPHCIAQRSTEHVYINKKDPAPGGFRISRWKHARFLRNTKLRNDWGLHSASARGSQQHTGHTCCTTTHFVWQRRRRFRGTCIAICASQCESVCFGEPSNCICIHIRGLHESFAYYMHFSKVG